MSLAALKSAAKQVEGFKVGSPAAFTKRINIHLKTLQTQNIWMIILEY